MTKNRLIAAVLGAAFLFGAGWTAQGWRLSGQLAQLKQEHAEQHLAMAEAAKQIGIEANNTISAADARAWKGLEDDKKELSRLRGCVADGTCSVHLKSSSPKQSVSGADTTSSMGNAASGISQGTAERVFDLYEAVNSDAAKIGYLQTYAGACWRAVSEASKLSRK